MGIDTKQCTLIDFDESDDSPSAFHRIDSLAHLCKDPSSSCRLFSSGDRVQSPNRRSLADRIDRRKATELISILFFFDFGSLTRFRDLLILFRVHPCVVGNVQSVEADLEFLCSTATFPGSPQRFEQLIALRTTSSVSL